MDGEIVAGALFDFGIWMNTWFTSTLPQFRQECYFYIPKIEHYLEARWWSNVMAFLEDHFNLQRGSFKAIVLIENILAAFQMDEIIYEFRDHCLALNTGKWDYIFSFIKKFRHDPSFVLPDRSCLGMDQPFLSSYEKLLIQTCKKRGCFATGGMAPQLRGNSEEENQLIFKKIVSEKSRGAKATLDGELVADPKFVLAVKEAYQIKYPTPERSDELQLQTMLLSVPKGAITLEGIVFDTKVCINYIEAWLQGVGGLALDGVVEDLATAEISRSQLWQWIKHGATTRDGTLVTTKLVVHIIDQHLQKLKQQLGPQFSNRKFSEARKVLVEELLDTNKFVGFMPDILYPMIRTQGARL